MTNPHESWCAECRHHLPEDEISLYFDRADYLEHQREDHGA